MSFTWFAAQPLRTREQVALEVHAVSLARGLDELASVLCLMGISTEVGTGTGDDRKWWCPANDRVPATKNYPNDSKSDDNRSSGYLQQQPGPNGEPWWGTPEQMMTLRLAADSFLSRLPDDYTRAAGNPALAGQFVQRVQQSAFPDRYTEKWDEAWAVLRRALGDQPTPTPGGTPVGYTGDPVWLLDVLNARPLLKGKVRALDGWDERGHGDFGDIWGVLWHHTGNGRATAESIRDGRPDLAGPVSNIHIAQDGTVTVVAVGVAWHAGAGSGFGLPANNANDRLIGIECAWPMDTSITEATQTRERWPDAQIISMREVAAALTLKLGYDASHNIGHKEWAGAAQGKWDPGNLDMDWFRGEVAKSMRGEFGTPATPPVVTPKPQPVRVGPADDQLTMRFNCLGGKTLVEAIAQIRDKVCGTEDRDKEGVVTQ